MSECIFLRNRRMRMLAVLAAFFMVPFLGMIGCGTVEMTEAVQSIEVIMIHNNPCESCDEPAKLMELLRRLAPVQGAGSDYQGTVYYAYRGEGYELVERAVQYFGLDKKDIVYPLVIIGDRYLMGYPQLEEKLTECLSQAGTAGVTAAMTDADGITKDDKDPENTDNAARANMPDGMVRIEADAEAEAVHLLYFHTEICGKCERAEEFFQTLPGDVEIEGNSYPLAITALSTAEEDNALLFIALAEHYQVPEGKQQVPFLFLGDAYLSGEKEIREQTARLIAEGKGLGYVYEADLATAHKERQAQGENMAVFLLKTVGVGFLNGFNPCALSLTLLFLSLIAAMPRGFLRYGLAFLAGKFLAYMLLGLAASTALSAIPFEAFAEVRYALNLVLLLLCVLLAAGNLMDCYHAARGEFGRIRVQLPARLRRYNNELVKRIVSPKAGKLLITLIFLGSMGIACGEFFCTGQIYLASILQWIQSDQGGVPILAFCLYSAALCLPSLFILLMVSRGKSVFSLTSKSLKGMPLIKLCNAAIFMIFAILTILSLR